MINKECRGITNREVKFKMKINQNNKMKKKIKDYQSKIKNQIMIIVMKKCLVKLIIFRVKFIIKQSGKDWEIKCPPWLQTNLVGNQKKMNNIENKINLLMLKPKKLCKKDFILI